MCSARPNKPEGVGEGGQADVPLARAPCAEPFEVPSRPERCNAVMLSFLLFCAVCFVVWVFSAGKKYREEHAQATEGWRVGTSRRVEVTLVKRDKQNLACESDQDLWGLSCSGPRELGATGPDPRTLQPLNTVRNELFLGAGLWSSLERDASLPERRFTAVCNYHIKGIVKSARIRFSAAAPFTPLAATVTAGTLTDCMVPR